MAISSPPMDLAPDPIDAAASAPSPRGDPGPLAALEDHARAFVDTPPREKAALLRAIVPRLAEIAPELAARAGGSPRAWLEGPVRAVATARLLAESLDDIAALGRPALALRDLGKRRDGRLVARLAGRSWVERAAQQGRETMVIFAPGAEPEDVIAEQAAGYRGRDDRGVTLVVASPNDPGAGLADALHALFVGGGVTLLSPSGAGAAPLIERALGPLAERGFFRVLVAGEEERADLAADARVASVSYAGHAAGLATITRGAPDEATFGKPVTALLGGGGVVIIVPCLYALDELGFLARSLAAELALPGPAAPRALLVSSSWPQRELFLGQLAQRLGAIAPAAGLPVAIEPDDDLALLQIQDAGRGIGVIRLSSNDPEELLLSATAFANDRLTGSLAAQIVVHPIHEEDPPTAAAIERAVFGLRYGAIGINEPPARLGWEGAAPWGAYPGATLGAPRSGVGFRGDARMLPRVEKSVIQGPLRSSRTPAHFVDDAAARAARRLVRFHAAPRARDLWALAGR